MTRASERWTHLFLKLDDAEARLRRANVLLRNVAGANGDDFYLPSLHEELAGLNGTIQEVWSTVRQLQAHPSNWDPPKT